jgi:hypothetical protein
MLAGDGMLEMDEPEFGDDTGSEAGDHVPAPHSNDGTGPKRLTGANARPGLLCVHNACSSVCRAKPHGQRADGELRPARGRRPF